MSDDDGNYAAWFEELDVDAIIVPPGLLHLRRLRAGSLDAVVRGLRTTLLARHVGG